jgi:hypothetical protein
VAVQLGRPLVDAFVAEAFRQGVGDHDQGGADHAAHQADGGGEAPITALDAAEEYERVQHFGRLGSNGAALEVVLLEADR